jgi:hypothetical protein
MRSTPVQSITSPFVVSEFCRRAAEAFVRAADAGLIDACELEYLLDQLTRGLPTGVPRSPTS